MHVRRDRRQSDLKWQEISFYGGALFANCESAEKKQSYWEPNEASLGVRESARWSRRSIRGRPIDKAMIYVRRACQNGIANVDHLFMRCLRSFRVLSPRSGDSQQMIGRRMRVAKTISSGRPKNGKVPLAAEIAQYSLLSFVVYLLTFFREPLAY